MNTKNNVFRLVLIGDSNVGKSSLLTRYVANEFDPVCRNTIGIDFREKTVNIPLVVTGDEKQSFEKEMKLQLWDTAGQERYKSLVNIYYRGAHGVILMYDVTSRESFVNVTKWIKELKEQIDVSKACFLLVGNKIDLKNRQISTKEGFALANQEKYQFFETSVATSYENIEGEFLKFCESLIQKRTPQINIKTSKYIFINPKEKTKKCCIS